MRPVLAGIETEFGFTVEDRGVEDQMDDATALVRSYPGERFCGWDYRFESPRADLRGFQLERLAVDPEDAVFDAGRSRGPDSEVRADRILPNGGRLYNDHGHPEYATPECWSLDELMLHELAGEIVVLRAARAFEANTGRRVKVYKNNTDFHGASYGTHESYLVPREVGFERLYRAVTPMLVARQVLCGAGKVGAESGPPCGMQLSQRADFLVDRASAETLYRRPVFNTRDEPHADPAKWIRLHVICGDANMIPSATRRKVGLVKLAILLEEAGEAPVWRLRDPVSAMKAVSRDESLEFRLELEGGSWTTAREVIESYLSAAESVLDIRTGAGSTGLEGEFASLILECRGLLDDLRNRPERFRFAVDWAAKKSMLEGYLAAEGGNWGDPLLRAFDLEYHNLARDDGLYHALAEMGLAEPRPDPKELESRLRASGEGTRTLARGAAVRKFGAFLRTACWHSLTFGENGAPETEVVLHPDVKYGSELEDAPDVGTFIERLRSLHDNQNRR